MKITELIEQKYNEVIEEIAKKHGLPTTILCLPVLGKEIDVNVIDCSDISKDRALGIYRSDNRLDLICYGYRNRLTGTTYFIDFLEDPLYRFITPNGLNKNAILNEIGADCKIYKNQIEAYKDRISRIPDNDQEQFDRIIKEAYEHLTDYKRNDKNTIWYFSGNDDSQIRSFEYTETSIFQDTFTWFDMVIGIKPSIVDSWINSLKSRSASV